MKSLMTLALAIGLSSASAADYVGRDLLTYFSSTCPSQGDWTKLVVSDAAALIDVLNNIKNDPDCVTAAGSISQLGGLAATINKLQSTSGQKIEIEKLKAKELELTTQLGQATDAATIDSLKTALREVAVEKAALLAAEKSKNELSGGDITEAYSQIILSTNQLYKSIANNPNCLDKNPRIMSSVTSLVSSIGGATAMVNPALGIGLSAASDFLGSTVEASRGWWINRRIRKFSDGTMINSGFKCVMESLSNRWCELSDARKLLEFKFNVIKNSEHHNGLLSIMSLYDRKIPSFLDWLSRVKAGAPAATEADASRHSIVYERLKTVQVARSKGDGVITEFRKRFDDPATTTTADKYVVIKQTISRLTGACNSASFVPTPEGGATNPLYDIYSQLMAPYRLLGLTTPPVIKPQNQPIDFCYFDPFTQWPEGTYVPNYDLIAKEYDKWILTASALVNKEFTLVLQPDSLEVLSSAFEKGGSKWKVSPKQAIDDLINFLVTNKPEAFETSAFQKIYSDTLKRLTLISNTLTDALILENVDSKKAIETIFNAADLQFGTIVFKSRLDMTVRISLDEYFRNAKPEDENVAAQMLALESYLETLRKISGKDTDELVMLDIQNAQKGALSNMRSFVEVFSKNLGKLLEMNDQKIKGSKDNSQRLIDEEDQTKLCLLLSSMPQLHKKIDISLCYGKQLKPFIKGGPSSNKVTEGYLKTDFAERSCAYRDYIRKSKIYREWDIKL